MNTEMEYEKETVTGEPEQTPAEQNPAEQGETEKVEQPVERVGEFEPEKLSGLFDKILPEQDKILLVYAKDGKIVCDRTSREYLAERNRKRAEAAYKKGISVGKTDIARTKFHDGYYAGYMEGKNGMPFRDPDAENAE